MRNQRWLGVRPSIIDRYVVDGAVRFNAVFRRNSSGHGWSWNDNAASFSALAATNLDASALHNFDERQRAVGRHITWLRTYSGSGWVRYLAVACRG